MGPEYFDAEASFQRLLWPTARNARPCRRDGIILSSRPGNGMGSAVASGLSQLGEYESTQAFLLTLAGNGPLIPTSSSPLVARRWCCCSTRTVPAPAHDRRIGESDDGLPGPSGSDSADAPPHRDGREVGTDRLVGRCFCHSGCIGLRRLWRNGIPPLRRGHQREDVPLSPPMAGSFLGGITESPAIAGAITMAARRLSHSCWTATPPHNLRTPVYGCPLFAEPYDCQNREGHRCHSR